MKIRLVKKINESTEEKENVLVNKQTVELEKEELTPVVDMTTAATLVSKEHNEKAAEENIEASGIREVADEVVKNIQDPKKDTPAPKTPSMKPYTEAKQVKDRRELSALIKESKEAGRKFKISRSLEEGYRYIFEEFEDAFPECYFVCHSDEDANNENGYFDTLEDATAYAEAHPEICCIFRICDNEEEKVWERTLEEALEPIENLADQEVITDISDVEIETPAVVDEVEVTNEPEIPETFEGKMDFLAADEDEAISGYELIINALEEGNVKEQLNKILEEERAHKEFLEAVKEDQSLVYSHEHEGENNEETEENVELDESLTSDKPTVGDLIEFLRDKADELEYNYDSETKITKVSNTYFLGHPYFFLGIAGYNGGYVNLDTPVDEDEEYDDEYEESLQPTTELKEAIVEPQDEPEFTLEDTIGATPVEADIEITDVVELDPEAEIEIDSLDTFEPAEPKAKTTLTTIKDAGDDVMWAFKDTLKDLYDLKIKVGDLQTLLSDSSEWLLDLLGFNSMPKDPEIHSDELPDVAIDAAELESQDFGEPVTDISNSNMNDFDDVEPVEYEEEDEKFFVED